MYHQIRWNGQHECRKTTYFVQGMVNVRKYGMPIQPDIGEMNINLSMVTMEKAYQVLRRYGHLP